MPKYRNKKRLEEIIASGKELTPLSRHLILQGESYEEASQGLAPYVSGWEQSVKYIEESSVKDIGYSEEYDHDLWARTELYKVSQYASAEELNRYKQRIEQADSAFKNATVASDFANRHIDNPDKELHWWLFRGKKE